MKKLEKKILEKDKTNEAYRLTVKVDVKSIPVQDVNLRGEVVQYQSKMIYLVPVVSTGTTKFFDAWLPFHAYSENNEVNHNEVIVQFSYPVDKALRCGVCRKNKNYPDNHHLVLISTESMEDLFMKLNGRSLQVTVLPDMVGEEQVGY